MPTNSRTKLATGIYETGECKIRLAFLDLTGTVYFWIVFYRTVLAFSRVCAHFKVGLAQSLKLGVRRYPAPTWAVITSAPKAELVRGETPKSCLKQ